MTRPGRLASQLGALADSLDIPSRATGRPTQVDPQRATNRDEFGEFVLAVFADFAESGHREWENNTRERFLDGLGAFALARVNGRADEEQEQASWALFAELIVAATGYEMRTQNDRLAGVPVARAAAPSACPTSRVG